MPLAHPIELETPVRPRAKMMRAAGTARPVRKRAPALVADYA